MVGGVRGRKDGHCSGRYESYWNAFLFEIKSNVYTVYSSPCRQDTKKKQFVSAVLMTQQEITDFSGNLNDFSGKIIIFIYYFYFKLYYCRGGSLILVLKMWKCMLYLKVKTG